MGNLTNRKLDYYECNSIQELFEKIRKESNDVLRRDPRFGENIMEAVYLNDFSSLQIDKGSDEYTSALRLTALKNTIIADLTKKALAEYGEKLGITEAEKTTILGFQKMIPSIDEIYIKWRQQLFPVALHDESGFRKDAIEYLKKNELDDPYAIVEKIPDGSYECVPYALAFPEDYKKLITTIEKLILDISLIPSQDFGKKMNRKTLVTYLESYRDALSCAESKKVGGEWKSVKLWKTVDRAWIKCQDRIQFIHGIENGYDSTIDPSETKVVPELKLAVQYTTPETDNLIKAMKKENTVVLTDMIKAHFGERAAVLTDGLSVMSKSHVGMINVISGGGNSMDLLGSAQVGPNYADIRIEEGVKAYVSATDLFEGEPLRDLITRKIFDDERANCELEFLVNDEVRNQYVAQFIAGHELGHVFADEIEDFEETKATWVAMLATYNREKQGSLPAGTSEAIMKGQLKYCLKYLADTFKKEFDDYYKEGIINVKLFLQSGLMSKKTDEKYEFHPERIDATYQEMQKLFLQFVGLYMAGDEDALRKWVKVETIGIPPGDPD
ncbi:MAG: hypothetical protein WCX95_01960 [Candidatus Gracilibacteria bacterium]